MSLLQGVLRNQTFDLLEKNHNHSDSDNSEDELINVASVPGTPPYSRPATRPTSPSSGLPARSSNLYRPATRRSRTDPLRALPTELSQRVFSLLDIKDLAVCARVSKKWSTSQSINYVWFRHYRKENFHDTSLPPGKWTKRESKQNWRIVYVQSIPTREQTSMGSGYATSGSQSGYQTPRELKEERWRLEADAVNKPSKNELREMYKELGGRKSKTKGKVGGNGRTRDKGGLGTSDD